MLHTSTDLYEILSFFLIYLILNSNYQTYAAVFYFNLFFFLIQESVKLPDKF